MISECLDGLRATHRIKWIGYAALLRNGADNFSGGITVVCTLEFVSLVR